MRSIDTDAPESVHLAYWPVADRSRIDESLNAETQLVKRICSLGRAARAKAQIKVRQPVQEVWVKTRGLDANEEAAIKRNRQLVLEELNARELKRLLGDASVVRYEVKPNLPVLGPRLGPALANVRRELSALSPELIELARRRNPIVVAGISLEPGDLLFEAHDEPGYATASDGGYTVAISTVITPDLADEGLAREIVRRVQDMRREAGFALSDRITLWYAGLDGAPVEADVARVMQTQAAYIQGETLATAITAGDPPSDAHRAEQDLEGTRLLLAVRRN